MIIVNETINKLLDRFDKCMDDIEAHNMTFDEDIAGIISNRYDVPPKSEATRLIAEFIIGYYTALQDNNLTL